MSAAQGADEGHDGEDFGRAELASPRRHTLGRYTFRDGVVDVDPAALRTKLKLRGDESATLLVTRIGSKRVAILADRVTASR